jgi:hypothetical protein
MPDFVKTLISKYGSDGEMAAKGTIGAAGMKS